MSKAGWWVVVVRMSVGGKGKMEEKEVDGLRQLLRTAEPRCRGAFIRL